MKYQKVVIKILDDYINCVTKNEINILVNILKKNELSNDDKVSDEIVIFINNILNRIWNVYLTNIKDFNNGGNFNFLIKDIGLYFESNDSNKIVDINNCNYKIINEKNIENKSIEDCGLIIKPNYTDNLRTIPILPNDFKNDEIIIEDLNYTICGYYVFDTKLNNLDSNIAFISELNNDLKIVKINKEFYITNKKKFEKDLLSIHTMFVIDYLFSIDNHKDLDIIKCRDIIVLSTKKEFNKIYKLLLNKKITLNDFKNLAFELFKSIDIDKKNVVCYIKGVKK